jgi:hypothetical protein
MFGEDFHDYCFQNMTCSLQPYSFSRMVKKQNKKKACLVSGIENDLLEKSHVPLATSLSSISLTFNTCLPAQAATSGTLFLCYLLPALPLSHGGWHSSTSSRSRRRVRCLLLRHRAVARRSLLTCPTSARAVLAAPTDHSCADLSSPHDGI